MAVERKKKKSDVIVVRLADDLVNKLDVYAEKMAAQHAGMRVTRSDVVRLLLTRALGEEESKKSKR